MKKYKAIFFDWDGTAVINRSESAKEVASYMKALLRDGTVLIIISGTTYGNIDGGELHTRFSDTELENLFLGLGRGSINLGFNGGKLIELGDGGVDLETLLKVHDISYGIHAKLLLEHGINTNLTFSRPSYVKIDILPEMVRTNLYLSGDEIAIASDILQQKGVVGGIPGLVEMANALGQQHGLTLKTTCDAKYLEVGTRNKSDNVDFFFDTVLKKRGINASECCFWGDEYLMLGNGFYGSDSFMYTEKSKDGDFYDVGTLVGNRPDYVKQIGGGIQSFIEFLKQQVTL